jgi:hypothetical protein
MIKLLNSNVKGLVKFYKLVNEELKSLINLVY